MKTLNFKKAIPYIFIIFLLIIIYFFYKKNENLNQRIGMIDNLNIALNDSLIQYHNSYNELVSEKLTLQSDIQYLKEINGQLTESQRELLDRIIKLEKNTTVIAAALIETNVKIDSLKGGNVIVTDTNVTFTDIKPEIEYLFRVNNIKPLSNKKPNLIIEKLILPNTQFIEFHWKNNRKEGYPIAFSVSNSNPYFITTNIDSYVIPEIIKPEIKPNFWQKTWTGVKKSGVPIITFGLGVGLGLLVK
jgi:hypothetical protein